MSKFAPGMRVIIRDEEWMIDHYWVFDTKYMGKWPENRGFRGKQA